MIFCDSIILLIMPKRHRKGGTGIWPHVYMMQGEGNVSLLQCSSLENPSNGVAQSRTGLKWLSSSSSIHDAETRFSCCRKLFGMYLDWFWLDLLCLSSSDSVPPLLTWTSHLLTWKQIWDAEKPFSLLIYKSFMFPVIVVLRIVVQSFICFK